MFKKIYIEITNICNLKCSFCPSNQRDKKYMSVSDFKRVLKSIEGHTEYIYLHVMGEPLMHPNLDEILDEAYKHNFKVNITTNARLLKNKLDILNEAKSIRQINISLHSFNPDDISKIDELIETVNKLNQNYYVSLRLWNEGTNNNQKLINILKKYYDFDETKLLSNKGIKLKNNLYLDQDIVFEWSTLDREVISDKGTCYGLRQHIGVLVDGTVVPCCLDSEGKINLGNIFESSLDSILNKEKCKQIKSGFLNQKLVESLCKRCSYINRFKK